jgi:hypothetical protein
MGFPSQINDKDIILDLISVIPLLEFVQSHVRMECPNCGAKLVVGEMEEMRTIRGRAKGSD